MKRKAPLRARAVRKGSDRVVRDGTTAERGADFPIVAIGASAGGLGAFRTLLNALPADTGMAFILVQHLDPSHASMMAALLSSNTAIPVAEATEGERVEPDHIYVIPPGRYLELRYGAVRLSEPPGGGAVRMPFDCLLNSLAEELGERAVCVILSGTASDGSIGAESIKEAGGLVVAQDPDEAEYDGMPRSAIAAGGVDLVLPLVEIPGALATYAGHRYTPAGRDGAPAAEGVAQIVALLRNKTSHDFSIYKDAMLQRRIHRRMALRGVEQESGYLALLLREPDELDRLVDDLFVNVTRFFRDPSAFDLLAKTALPDLVRHHPPDQPIRVWVVGCSTGEEAYSIAILLLEQIASAGRALKVQVFATDNDAAAVALAREGLYARTIEADVSAARLGRFFSREERGYRVSRDLRASVVFSVHDVVTEAPFSRLDIVSCRNLLIYLRSEAQEKVISLFHFALLPGGYLLLGGSEGVGAASDRFERIQKTQRLYRHIGRSRPGDVELPMGRGGAARSLWPAPAHAPAHPRPNIAELAQGLLLDAYAPASVLVGARRQTLYSFGATDLYLRLPTGEASLDVLACAKEGLRSTIRIAIERADQGQEPIVLSGRVKRGAEFVSVSVSARSIRSVGEALVLVSFRDLPAGSPRAEADDPSPADVSRVADLEEELSAARRDLDNAVRDREIAEEEIRAINEEAMSVSEEFQTTNEELETSQEELQSLNEELTALNGQLQETLSRYQSTADDLQNVLNSADMAMIFLDRSLRIRFFTPATQSLFSVIASDIGRPLRDLTHRFANPHLLEDAEAVIANLAPVVREVQGEGGAWYNCRTLPYRTKDDRIDGVVITLADVTARKRAEDVANAARVQAQGANLTKSQFLAAASHDLRQPLQTLSLLQGLLRNALAGSEALQFVARGDEALLAISGMLNTLLDINQLELGGVHPEMTAFPVAELLERLRSEFAYHTQSKGLTWTVVPCRLSVRSDPRLLDQMLRNILSNAVKYTDKGRLLLGCRRRGDRLRIEVWDTGIGIANEQLQMIFEEFHQVGNPERNMRRGLGLGLTIVQRLGALLGHPIVVNSRPGAGSMFAVELPMAPQSVLVSSGAAARTGAVPPAKGSILIVEDEEDVRSSLEQFLHSEGHSTAGVASGDQAQYVVERHEFRPDLVVIDYNMPGGGSGLDVMARLRQTLGPGVQALVLTGEISTRALRDIAAQGYLQRNKPIAAGDLAHLVQRLLLREESRVQPTQTIYVVDDDGAVRDATRALLEQRGMFVRTYANAEVFLENLPPGQEGCVLVDAAMPGMDGLTLLERLRDAGSPLPAIMITGVSEVQLAVRALRAGAVDFLEKPVAPDVLIASIDKALDHARDAAKREASRVLAVERVATLTPRQRKVLDLVLEGRPSKIIAAELGLSQRTVEHHRAAIMSKTGARSVADLVRSAIVADAPAKPRT